MKVSLHLQVKEAKRELALRQYAYPEMVGRGKMRQSESDYRIDNQRAIIATLEWLQENEAVVRTAIERKALVAAAPKLLDNLKSVEWAAVTDREEGGQEDACPSCGGAHRLGHNDGCELKAAIAAAEAQ